MILNYFSIFSSDILHLAAEKIYQYIWHRFADEILEESKEIIKKKDKESEERKIALALVWLDCLKISSHLIMTFRNSFHEIDPSLFKSILKHNNNCR